MLTTDDTMTSSPPERTGALLRHFADLRDGSHGGATPRRDKERLFNAAVALLDPHTPKHSTRSTQISSLAPARSPPPGFGARPRPVCRPSGRSRGRSSERPGSSRS